jgi:hypothetical protein
MGKVLVIILRSQWDRVAAITSVVLGAVALVSGWLGVSGTAYEAEQVPYIVSGGLVGIFLLGLAAALWLSADLRDEWRQLGALERRVGSVEARLQTSHPADASVLRGESPMPASLQSRHGSAPVNHRVSLG